MSIQTKPAPKEIKPKVYCSECIHYYRIPGDYFVRNGLCYHDSNYKMIVHDWYEKHRQSPIKEPKELNKNNDCKNFKSKEN